MKNRSLHYFIVVGICAGLLFIPFIGNMHLFDWDEINFAESAREMILTDNYSTVQINYEPFWEKPPLFIWFQVVSMKLFGINEFAARLPNAVCGILTMLFLFHLGRKQYDNWFGLLLILSYAGSILPFLYFKSGIIDPWFNLLIFISICYWISSLDTDKVQTEYKSVFISAFCLGSAVLTKGPVAVLIFGMVAGIILLIRNFRLDIKWKSIALFGITFIITGGAWFIVQIASGKSNLVIDFVQYQIRLFRTEDAGHGGFPMYHFVILLFGVFPASVFAIKGHKKLGVTGFDRLMHSSMIILLWVVLILFSIVKTKIVHYSSLCYFPIAYLSAYFLYNYFYGKTTCPVWLKILFIIIGSLAGLLLILMSFFNPIKEYVISHSLISDSFTLGNLQADPHWSYGLLIIGILFIAGIIISIFFLNTRRKFQVVLLFVCTIIYTNLSILLVAPGAEKISQNAAIVFIKNARDTDAYAYSFYKSYAPLFYGDRPVPDSGIVYDQEWFTHGTINKDVYFIARNRDKVKIETENPSLKYLYEKNGYIFFVRYKNQNFSKQ